MERTSTKSFLFWTGLFLLFFPGLLHAYLLMPFPGSQNLEAVKLCYYLEKIILPLRIAGGLVLIAYFVKYFIKNSLRGKTIKGSVLGLGLISFYITDIEYKASAMFEEPLDVKFANAIDNKVPETNIVLGVVSNGVAKAYPLVYLGYHHKIQDKVGALPVLVTYCTMCRSGRVYSPVINGVRENFRLVGQGIIMPLLRMKPVVPGGTRQPERQRQDRCAVLNLRRYPMNNPHLAPGLTSIPDH